MDIQGFKDKVTKVGDILKMGVEFDSDDNMKWNKRAYLVQDRQRIGILYNDYQQKFKLYISVVFPCTKKREFVYRSKSPSINVSETKTPEQIARDIEKRLLPAYLPELEKVLDYIQQADNRDQKRLENIQKMADYFEVVPQNDIVYTYDQNTGVGYKIEANEDTVKFELKVSPEMAIKIFNLLKKEE